MTTITERLNRLRFNHAVKAICATPPVRNGTQPFAALSMVRRSDVLAYLLAIKSFAHFAQPHRIILIADPSLRPEDEALLRQHVPMVEILPAARFRDKAIPAGGCWERLAAIAALNAEITIVQLDADTVTFAYPTEAVQAARAGQTFLLRAEADVEIVDLAAAAANGRHRLAESRHIQAVAEARLGELPQAETYRYARGCAAFTGFGRGVLSPDKLHRLSAQMRAIHGARWDEWGSEQVASNLLAASAPGAILLPRPRYCNADAVDGATVLAHYIGYMRFRTRDYEHRARTMARLLGGPPTRALEPPRFGRGQSPAAGPAP